MYHQSGLEYSPIFYVPIGLQTGIKFTATECYFGQVLCCKTDGADNLPKEEIVRLWREPSVLE